MGAVLSRVLSCVAHSGDSGGDDAADGEEEEEGDGAAWDRFSAGWTEVRSIDMSYTECSLNN